ncbi:MAG: cyclic nucleotide-binding domain-containing protein, partial [Planctomycetes bacterium]|nr:cyclic nucleotide-binding domain-containing protein [Planctomycetota bacterium]
AHISAKLEPIKYKPSETIIQQGDLAEHLYIIVKGQVDVFIHHKERGEIKIDALTSGQLFGEMGLLDGGKRNATVKAAPYSEVIVMQLDRKAFLKLIEDSDKSKNEILHLMRQRVMNIDMAEAIPIVNPTQLIDITAQNQTRQTYKPGEIIIKYGDPADAFYIITSGQAEVINHRPNGTDMVVARLEAGKYFGELGLIRQAKRMATVRAATDSPVEVISIDRDTFTKLMGENQLSVAESSRVLSRHYLKST